MSTAFDDAMALQPSNGDACGEGRKSTPDAAPFNTYSTVAKASAPARKTTALDRYVHGHVSLGYCAEMAGLTEEEFIAFLGQNNVDVFQFESDDELLRDIANA